MSKSPYVERLQLQIAQASDPALRASRRAELAACQARSGAFEAAEQEIARLRAEYGDGRSGRVSILIMCAEAQLIYYRELGEQARDRMVRAQLLSIAGRDAGLSALTSAWLAHISFNLYRPEEMLRAAKTCLDTLGPDDHEAAARLALTLGDAFHAAEEPAIGLRWYTKAHQHAVRLGDHSTIGACLYNRAAMGTFMSRVRAVTQTLDPDVVVRLHSEVRSAATYQALAQMNSLHNLLDYSLASVRILAERHAEALEPLRRLVQDGCHTSPIERSLVLSCDLALCLARSGRREEAAVLAGTIPVEQLADYAADDRVVASAALADAARACRLDALREEAEAQLAVALDDHRATVDGQREGLAPFAAGAALAQL